MKIYGESLPESMEKMKKLKSEEEVKISKGEMAARDYML